jgi:hypothetical protein
MAIYQLIVTSFALFLGLTASSHPSAKPNIIIILADDLVRLLQKYGNHKFIYYISWWEGFDETPSSEEELASLSSLPSLHRR